MLTLRIGLMGAPLTQERVARGLQLTVASIPAIEKRALEKVTQVLIAAERQEIA
ncbi:MAG: hypothetical protein M1482_17775 [Chloroflexi bacterium]|nr:hypothetical protein [Chloroflexota bacterium]